ncbi:carboxymuconolactone decarboxylase family protein [Actinoplanes sp. NPDC089786]|uniref:carboxymuconolactone decarboxylase family protein n=1 Tax=Actinoplanes sp. NPDC089786 TaxID=3155185 RepID=UPI00342B599E
MRVEDVDPAGMSDEQRSLYEWYTTGRRASPDSPFQLSTPDGKLQGPPAVWILSPAFGQALQKIGGVVRYESALPARGREIAILLVGHHHRSAFELYAHTRAGRAAGLSEHDLAALADGKEPSDLSAAEGSILRATKAILDRGTLDDLEYRDTVDILGEPGLLELVTIVGYYNMVAWQLAVFDVQPPAA